MCFRYFFNQLVNCFKLCGLFLLVPILLTACNNHKIHSVDTLNVDIGAEVPTLDPQAMEDMKSIRVANDLFEGLVSFDQSNKIIPGLAESWSISTDRKVYIFNLRPNIKFSDGSPITSEDVVFSFRRLLNPKTGSPYTLIASSILNANEVANGTKSSESLGVYMVSNNKVKIILRYADNDFLAKLMRPSFSIISKHNVDRCGSRWIEPKCMVTSGAYSLKEHVINGYILLTKNLYYYEESSVKIANIKFYPLVDANTSVSKYRSGELDMTWSVPIDQFSVLKKHFINELYISPIEATVYYNLNLLIPELKDIRLRKALSLAIDRNLLTKHVLQNGVVPLYSVVTPTIEYGKYNGVTYQWSTDNRENQISLAKKLYKEAGYGVSRNFNTTITYFTNDEQKKVALAIASMWKTVLGVEVTLKNQDWKSFLNTRRQGEYQISFGRWYADYNGVTTYFPIFQCNSTVNYTKYCSNAYDTYINLAMLNKNSSEQANLYKDALNIALNSYSIIPLYQLSSVRLVKPYVKGYDPRANNLDMVKSRWMHF